MLPRVSKTGYLANKNRKNCWQISISGDFWQHFSKKP
jgi:hypothetical protein